MNPTVVEMCTFTATVCFKQMESRVSEKLRGPSGDQALRFPHSWRLLIGTRCAHQVLRTGLLSRREDEAAAASELCLCGIFTWPSLLLRQLRCPEEEKVYWWIFDWF